MCFRADQKNKMAALASDWLRHFRLLFWNCCTEFNETWQEARSQRHLPSLCFSGRSENRMAALVSDWLRHFRLFLWNRWTEFNKNLTRSKISTSSTKFVFSGFCFPGRLGYKMAALTNPSKRFHIVLRCTLCGPLGLLVFFFFLLFSSIDTCIFQYVIHYSTCARQNTLYFNNLELIPMYTLVSEVHV